MTRAITSRFCSPGGTLSPNTRMYGVFSFCARSMKRRPSSSCACRTLGSASCMRADAPRSLIFNPRASRSLMDWFSPVPVNSGRVVRSIFISMPRTSIAA
jgi:hypothetical protein